VREEAICAKVYRRTDGQTDDGRLAIALAYELKIDKILFIVRVSDRPHDELLSAQHPLYKRANFSLAVVVLCWP